MIDNSVLEMDIKQAMTGLATALDEILNGRDVKERGTRRHGFVLLMYPYDDTSAAMYISNGATVDEIAAMFQTKLDNLKKENEK